MAALTVDRFKLQGNQLLSSIRRHGLPDAVCTSADLVRELCRSKMYK